ncbi:MAG: HEPN domain-containing protein [Anaerolineae bacterium]|nr:HEPN domain-containing protein [Anaerolineae bacterium]
MNDASDWLELVTKAEGDYVMALAALRRKRPITFAACFHAQQCAEKYLKAMLLAYGRRFARIHDLAALNKQCEEAGIFTGISKDALQTLSYYAIETRYFGTEPLIDEARNALETARAVRKFARKFLGVK